MRVPYKKQENVWWDSCVAARVNAVGAQRAVRPVEPWWVDELHGECRAFVRAVRIWVGLGKSHEWVTVQCS